MVGEFVRGNIRDSFDGGKVDCRSRQSFCLMGGIVVWLSVSQSLGYLVMCSAKSQAASCWFRMLTRVNKEAVSC